MPTRLGHCRALPSCLPLAIQKTNGKLGRAWEQGEVHHYSGEYTCSLNYHTHIHYSVNETTVNIAYENSIFNSERINRKNWLTKMSNLSCRTLVHTTSYFYQQCRVTAFMYLQFQ